MTSKTKESPQQRKKILFQKKKNYKVYFQECAAASRREVPGSLNNRAWEKPIGWHPTAGEGGGKEVW